MSREVRYVPVKRLNPGVTELLIGMFIGALIFPGPFIWTHLGREMVKEAIARGAGVTRARIEEWLKKGEREK